jgi:hypothetical protein
MTLETDAYLTYEEVENWSRIRPNDDYLIDPRLLDWLRKHNFDLNQPIRTKQNDHEGRFCYSQPRMAQ